MIDDPRVAQAIASSPGLSAFVTANAGSGKTTTLVSRVARLLLAGARPEAILCVTYTKAAAAEMQRRLYQRLGGWSVADDATLAEQLRQIGEDPTRVDPARARALFARALETPGGLKIQTIHAFCEKLLRRFPLEAGVSPGFQVLEGALQSRVSAAAREQVAELATLAPDHEIGRAYAHFAVRCDFQAFEDLFGCFEGQREKIRARIAEAEGDGGLVVKTWRTLGFDGPVTVEEVERQALSALSAADLAAGAAALATGAKGDQANAEVLYAQAEALRSGGGDVPTLLGVFFTAKGTGTPVAWVEKSAALRREPLAQEAMVRVQTTLETWRERRRAAVVGVDSGHALAIARAYVGLYEAEKRRRRALDFGDLIGLTARLLNGGHGAAAWVLFKLDGGLDHVLVDEAQDTAPEQWAVVRALTEEFFAGQGAREQVRTVFAVGDEKQSIYSFQGAEPERLQEQTKAYTEKAAATGADFRVPVLAQSWRSTPEVLAFVDAVFADPDAMTGVPVPIGAERIVHPAMRTGVHDRGGVDLWPVATEEKKPEREAWDAPLDAKGTSSRKRLAQWIAEAIAAMIERREAVYDKDQRRLRPVTCGDVLILVRRRDGTFEEIIRALKKRGLPVAGADRLKLSEHVVNQDLISLARFCLYPGDDLSLAEVLRSPFCDLDEQDLYDLAYGRDTRSLWATLNARKDERPCWAEAARLLGWARDEALRRGPFDFYGRFLSRLDSEGRSMRRRVLTRLGREAEDALDESLAQALAGEQAGQHDLERWLAAQDGAEIEVKRELEDARGEVRVMTVHGAKGLEAPVVILPDTAQKPKTGGAAWMEAGEVFFYAPRKGDDCKASEAARAARDQRQAEESRRLLYVALTRARDRLIVCGRVGSGKTAREDGSWYDLVERPFRSGELDVRPVEGVLSDAAGPVLRFGVDPTVADALEAEIRGEPALPDWARQAARSERRSGGAESPSKASGGPGGDVAPSPLARAGGLGRFRRGDLIHRLFQLVPDAPLERRRDFAARLLAREPDLDDAQRAEMVEAAFGVLEDPRFAEVFGPGSRPEVALAGSAPELGARRFSGRMDRLVVGAERVLVVDYKTNRPAPDRAEDADPAYLAQMAVYVAILRRVYPGRRVEAALVWTDGPKLTPIPDDLIEASLKALAPDGSVDPARVASYL